MAEMDFIIYIKDHGDVERHCQFETYQMSTIKSQVDIKTIIIFLR